MFLLNTHQTADWPLENQSLSSHCRSFHLQPILLHLQPNYCKLWLLTIQNYARDRFQAFRHHHLAVPFHWNLTCGPVPGATASALSGWDLDAACCFHMSWAICMLSLSLAQSCGDGSYPYHPVIGSSPVSLSHARLMTGSWSMPTSSTRGLQ